MTGSGLPGPTVRRKALVSGRVQGVWYRDSCREEANRLGVRGSARNLPDGRVEVIAEGDPSAVDELLAWCRLGPPRARVVNVVVTDDDGPSGLTGFRIS